MKTIFRFFLPAALFAIASLSHAVENQKDEKHFYDSCLVFLQDSTDNAASACSDYLHGFLEGARIVESLFIDHLESYQHGLEGFSKRAFRTRVGKPDSSDLERPSAPFCLPDSEFNADILAQLKRYLPATVNSLEEMDQLVFTALTEEYPCR